MHVSAQMSESHAELIECDVSQVWVRNEVGNNNLATRNINTVVYFMLYFE